MNKARDPASEKTPRINSDMEDVAGRGSAPDAGRLLDSEPEYESEEDEKQPGRGKKRQAESQEDDDVELDALSDITDSSDSRDWLYRHPICNDDADRHGDNCGRCEEGGREEGRQEAGGKGMGERGVRPTRGGERTRGPKSGGDNGGNLPTQENRRRAG